MINNNNIRIFGQNFNLYVVGGFLFGFIFIVIAWGLEFWYKEIQFSLEGIEYIHQNLIIFIVDSAPFILAFVSYLLSRIIQKRENKLNEIIESKEKEVNQLGNFISKIGSGNFYVEANDFIKTSELGKALLKMKEQLAENDKKEKEILWINKGKEKILEITRKNTNLDELGYEIVKNLCQYLDIEQGAFYVYDDDEKLIKNYGTYAYGRKKYLQQSFKIGYGLIGQAAFEKDTIYRTEIPNNYTTYTSGLIRDKKPTSILIEPLIYNDQIEGIIELSSIHEFSNLYRLFIKEISLIISETLFNLIVNHKTKKFLEESQMLTWQLRKNEEELRQNAEEMRVTQEELKQVNKKLEYQIQEVENSQKKLERIMENASEVISIFDENYNVLYESPTTSKILGYNSRTGLNKNGISNLDKDIQEKFIKAFSVIKKHSNQVEVVKFEYHRKSDNQKIWLQTSIRNLLDSPGIMGFLLNTRDITAEITAEKEQRKRGQMQALSENSPDMIARLSNEGVFYYMNPSFKDFFKIKAQETINHSITQVNINDDFKHFIVNAIKQNNYSNGKKTTIEHSFVENDKKYFLTINIIPEYQNGNKEPDTFLIVCHDITIQKMIQEEIESKNKKVTESINYAYRIQSSILPNAQNIKSVFDKSFLFYKPKDVISGDFPWLFQRGDNVYLAVVDCTGHGVPGALLSLIAFFHLNNIVDHERELTAGEILDNLHQNVKKTLRQDVPGATTRDGMDIALIKYNRKKTSIIEFAGAHRPLYFNRNNEIIEYKGNRKAVGGISINNKSEENFTTHNITIQKNNRIYIFSDGLTDQIGGNDRTKYMNKRIKKIILENQKEAMFKIGNIFMQDFNTWKGNEKQIDDVLLIGIEF